MQPYSCIENEQKGVRFYGSLLQAPAFAGLRTVT